MSDRTVTWIRHTIAVGFAVVGLGAVVATIMVGHCSAFGGRCPAEAPPLLDDDVFWFAAAGAAVALVPAALLVQRFAGRAAVSVGAALAGAGLVGLVARLAVLG